MSNVQTVRDVYERLGRGDIPSLVSTFDPEIEWRLAEGHPYQPAGESWSGPDAVVRKFFMRAGGEWDGFAISPAEFLDAGDAVVVPCRYTGSYKATGERLDAQVCHVWKLSGGRIVSFQQYADTAQLQAVMGAPAGSRPRETVLDA